MTFPCRPASPRSRLTAGGKKCRHRAEAWEVTESFTDVRPRRCGPAGVASPAHVDWSENHQMAVCPIPGPARPETAATNKNSHPRGHARERRAPPDACVSLLALREDDTLLDFGAPVNNRNKTKSCRSARGTPVPANSSALTYQRSAGPAGCNTEAAHLTAEGYCVLERAAPAESTAEATCGASSQPNVLLILGLARARTCEQYRRRISKPASSRSNHPTFR
mmetsp:Transcript_71749/g.203550  ORF Transcript_71749/g.203550 Transcript_71749/m.203550 type:complete len:222 (+) Transcript_71749:1-666(+)